MLVLQEIISMETGEAPWWASQLSLDSEVFQFSFCLACQNSMITASQADAHWFMQQIRAETEGGCSLQSTSHSGIIRDK